MYYSTKTYGHDRGLSCAFRQPLATHSHCSLIHGYSLSFSFKFAARVLDDKNWVVDFGGLKELKEYLEKMFDHTLAVDKDDPKIKELMMLQDEGLADVRIMNGVGCEKFAEHAFWAADKIIQEMTKGRCVVVSCECSEHGANSAIYDREIISI
jgi:6-pyruvoyltetrahydropterin/6-carboxytetrahydropterin synthase